MAWGFVSFTQAPSWAVCTLATVFIFCVLHYFRILLGFIYKEWNIARGLKAFPSPPRHWLWGNLHQVRTYYIFFKKQIMLIQQVSLRFLILGPLLVVVFSPFYKLIKSLILGKKCECNHQDLQMCLITNSTNISSFHQLAGRGSDI